MKMITRQRPTVTVIIPTFNRSSYLGAAIDSILAQTASPAEVIVIDDGSTDDTPALVRSYGSAVRYVRKENGGKSTALNLGLEHAAGELIWIFDDDDIAAPNALELMLGRMEDPGVGFVHGSYVIFRSEEYSSNGSIDMASKDVEAGGPYQDGLGLHIGLMMQSFIMQPGMLVRKDCYAAVGPFDERLIRSQDYDMLLRLSRRFKAARVNEVVFYQRRHRGQRGTLNSPVKASNIGQVWIEYDKSIFRKIYDSYDLIEFLPGGAARPSNDAQLSSDARLSSNERITAHLVRGCIMGRRQLWDHAASDFRHAMAIAATEGRTLLTAFERNMVRQLLDIRNLDPTNIMDADNFLLAVSQVRSWRLREDIRAALLYPLPYVLRRSLNDETLSRTYRVLRTYARIATPHSAMMAGIAKMKSKLQLRQMQQHRRSSANA